MSRIVYGASCWECSDFNIKNCMGEECEGSKHIFCDKSLKEHDAQIKANERAIVLEKVKNILNECGSGFVGTFYYNLLVDKLGLKEEK